VLQIYRAVNDALACAPGWRGILDPSALMHLVPHAAAEMRVGYGSKCY
jgi:hypothetical protein